MVDLTLSPTRRGDTFRLQLPLKQCHAFDSHGLPLAAQAHHAFVVIPSAATITAGRCAEIPRLRLGMTHR